MLKSLRKALSIEDIRKRLLYTLAMLIVVRLGSQLPTPGVDPTFIQNFFAQQTGDAFNFFEAFTGGSFHKNVSICPEYHSIYHIIYYHAASDNSDSKA